MRYRAYRSGSWKLIEASDGETYLFDVVADPAESQNLASAHPQQLARLQASLENVRTELGIPPIDAAFDPQASPELDPATQERLRALGYLD